MFFLHGHVGGMRPAKPHRYSEPLGGADHNVGAPFPGWLEQREGERVGRHDEHGASRMDLLGEITVVTDAAVGGGILHEDAGEFAALEVDACEIADQNLDAESLRSGLDDTDGLRVAVVSDEERASVGLRGTHRHRFRGGGCFVEQRGVGKRHRGEIRDHGLEIQECLKPALGDLGLIGRVLRVPTRVLKPGPQDYRRRDGAVVAHPDIAAPDLTLIGKLADAGQCFLLAGDAGAAGGKEDLISKREWSAVADRRGNRFFDQRIDRIEAEFSQHSGNVLGIRPKVPTRKVIGRGEWVG